MDEPAQEAPPASPCPRICDTLGRLCGRVSVGGDWYWAGGRRVALDADRTELLLRFRPEVAATPAELPLVLQAKADPALRRAGLALVRVTEAGPRAYKELVATPAVSAVYPVLRDAAGRRLLVTDELVVRLEPAVDAKTLADAHRLRLLRPVAGLEGAWLLAARDHDAMAAAQRLVASGEVRWAHPAFWRERALHRIPDDRYFEDQWHHLNTGQEGAAIGVDLRTSEAWDLAFGEADTLIGVLDDGVDFQHPDLSVARRQDGDPLVISEPARLRRALDDGCCRHGTAVAGVAAATGDNDEGVAGVCPGCSVVPMFTAPGWDRSEVMAESLLEAMRAGVAVVNNSWGPFERLTGFDEGGAPPLIPLDDVQSDALQTLHDDGRGGLGTVVVFSAGNGNEDTADNPLVNHPTVIGVGALDDTGHKAQYSDYGDGVWVVAPSAGGRTSGIWTTDARGDDWGFNDADAPREFGDRDGDYLAIFGGTSAAAPQISGLVGLMLSANPELTAAQVKEILRRTARPVDAENGRYGPDADGVMRSPYYGYGLADARAAVEMAQGGAPTPGPVPTPGPTADATPTGADCQPEQGCRDPQQVCMQRVDRWGDVLPGEHGCVDGADDGCLAFCDDAWFGQEDVVTLVGSCMNAAADCAEAEACFR